MTKNNTLYSAKAIACFFVICVHVGYVGKIGIHFSNIARFAVPLFFMITGYYSYFENNNDLNNKINKRIKKY